MLDQYGTIRVASLAEWSDWVDLCERRFGRPSIDRTRRMNDSSCLNDLPISAWVEGYDPYVCQAQRWLWENVGPEKDECDSHLDEWPACPQVLAIPRDEFARNYDYRNPGPHSHSGDWRSFFRGKVGYDCWYVEFLFRNKTDADRFLCAVPTLEMPEDL